MTGVPAVAITRDAGRRTGRGTTGRTDATCSSPNDKEVEVTFADRRWVFPREDCVLLPVANTTTELLARFIGLRLLESLREKAEPLPEHLRIGVDENEGQWGFCDMTP